MMKTYELNPRKIALKALQIREKIFDNGGKSMYQFSFEENDRLKMVEEVSNFQEDTAEDET